MSQTSDDSYEFGPFRLEAGERRLLRHGTPVPLAPKAFDLLLVLVRHHGRLLEKEDLLKTLWPDMFVEEANLPSNVSLIRKALDENSDGERYIETVPKHGYRFVAAVQRTPRATPEAMLDRPAGGMAADAAHRRGLGGRVALVVLGALIVGAVSLVVRQGARSSGELNVVPLTTYRGGERYPSFSPDGRHLAFAWNGEQGDNLDIYTQPVGHEAPFRVTDDPAVDVSPAWSPDGRWIAFLRVRPDGTARVLLTTPLSRAERSLADVAAPSLRVGFFGPFLAWSPDSRWIVLADRPRVAAAFGLVLISATDGEKRWLTSPSSAAGNDTAPAFSPDGRTLAFIRILSFPVSELYLLRLTEDLEPRGDPRRLTHDDRRTTSPVWTPNGRELIVASGDVFSSRLYRVASNGSGRPREVASIGEAGPVLAVSHAGSRLAYVREMFDTNVWRLPLRADNQADGAPAIVIASTRLDFNQQFSPDGKQIAFVSNRSGATEIWVADSDGSRARRLTSFGGPLTECPRWSPSGDRLVFQSHRNGQLDVSLIGVNGGVAEPITSEPFDENVPSWSRDGRWIYFHSNRSGESQVWKARPDGSQAVQVTRHGGFAALESLDGRVLYYSKFTQGTVALWSAPVSGGAEVEVLRGLSDWSTFAPVADGIHFVAPPRSGAQGATIQFYSFAERRTTTVASMQEPAFLGLTVSADNRSLLFTQIDEQDSDVMLVEGFR